MKKSILMALPIAIAGVVSLNSAFGRIINMHLDENSTCNAFNLGVAEDGAVSEITPDFRPNMMVVNFNGFNNRIVDKSTYMKVNQFDGNIAKPDEAPQRLGYKFRGWKVTGVKTCADFTDADSCGNFASCAWKNNTCIKNPCIRCGQSMLTQASQSILAQASQSMLAQANSGDDTSSAQTDSGADASGNDENVASCYYGTYDAENDSCSFENDANQQSQGVLSLLG